MRVCPICHGPAWDDPFACMHDSYHNSMVDETIEGEDLRKEETKKYIEEWGIKVG